MEWLPHASSPVEMPVAGVQSTNSSSTRPATPKAPATAAALVQTGLQPTKDPDPAPWYVPELGATDPDYQSAASSELGATPKATATAAALVQTVQPTKDPDPAPWDVPELGATDPDYQSAASSELGATDPDFQSAASSERNRSLPKQPSRRTRSTNPLLKSGMFLWLALAMVVKLGTAIQISTENLPCPSPTKTISMFDSSVGPTYASLSRTTIAPLFDYKLNKAIVFPLVIESVTSIIGSYTIYDSMFQWIDNTKEMYFIPQGRNVKDLNRNNVTSTGTDLKNKLGISKSNMSQYENLGIKPWVGKSMYSTWSQIGMILIQILLLSMRKLNTNTNLPIIEYKYPCNRQYQKGIINSAGHLYLILHQQYPFTLCNIAHYTSLNPKEIFLKHLSPTPINIAHSTHIDENTYKFHCYDTVWIHHPSFQTPSTSNIPSTIISISRHGLCHFHTMSLSHSGNQSTNSSRKFPPPISNYIWLLPRKLPLFDTRLYDRNRQTNHVESFHNKEISSHTKI